jgi:hypothetical protein
MKIVTATEVFLKGIQDVKRKQFKDLLTIIELENEYFGDEDWGIESFEGNLTIDIDESCFTIDGFHIEDWLHRHAIGRFNSDKYLTIEGFK